MENEWNYRFGPVVGVDDLGRRLPEQRQTKPLDRHKYVAMFYFLCNGEYGDPAKMKPCNVSELLRRDPMAGYKPESAVWPKGDCAYYWGEPLFGYYFSRDEWVIRHHMRLLAYADVDFLIFDTTNAVEYLPVATKVLKVLDEAKKEGWKVPGIVYYTNTHAGEGAQRIYETVYKAGLYPDVWFRVDGKPLLITHEEECSEEVRNFFTIRESQWPIEPDRKNGFPWISFIRPQKVYYDKNGKHGVISVSVAQHPQVRMGDSAMYGEEGNWGRSFYNGRNHREPGAVDYGYNIDEQWRVARRKNPETVFVTGWNEWSMGKYKGTPDRPILMVDEADQEFSRDIEPMKGGHFDNYYMQLIGDIRKFKGTCATPDQGEKHTIDIDGDFSQWDAVPIEYRDLPGGTFPRNFTGFGGEVFCNETGRNEFAVMKAAYDDRNLYFYAKTRSAIVGFGQGSWMELYLSVGAHAGWKGYQFIANHCPLNETETTLHKFMPGLKLAEKTKIRYRCQGNEFMLAIPKAALGVKDAFHIGFKWADSLVPLKSIEDFYTFGDVAPAGRLNYLFYSSGK